jgi:hypothetical protein
MRKTRSRLSLSMKLIVFLGFLSVASQTFSQQRQPELIVFGQDTLVGISQHDFNVVLFSFSYLKSVENTLDLTSKQLSRQIDITTYLNEQLTLEGLKSTETDSIVMNLNLVIKKHERKLKREKFKQTLIYLLGGGVIAAETGLLFYTLLK